MKTNIFRLLFLLLASVVSGALLVLAFPMYDVGWLIWVGLVPLITALSGRSPRCGFLLSYIFGIIFFAGIFNWILEVPGYRLAHHAILILYLGLYPGFFGLIMNYLTKRCGATYGHIAAPFVWVSLEYLRSNFTFLALPWALLAHSQHQYPLVIQVASLTGTYSISFLIVLVNSSLAAAFLKLLSRYEFYRTPYILSHVWIKFLLISSFGLTGMVLLYGNLTLSKPLTNNVYRVSVIQGNIEQSIKWNRRYASFIMQTYSDLSIEAANDNPALIVWPEAATPGSVLVDSILRKNVQSMIKSINRHFLIGSAEYAKTTTKLSDQSKAGNAAFFFSPEGRILSQYMKIRLVPFGEYIPYEDSIPWPDFIAPEGRRTFEVPGQEYSLFQLDGVRFGVVICWESIFPDLFRKFATGGANFMVNLANEAVYGRTPASYQFLSMNVFRAVENKISIARATNTGISCFIDPYGRIIGRIENEGKATFVKGYLTKELPILLKRSFYTDYGYVFVYINLIIAGLIFGLSFFRTKKRF